MSTEVRRISHGPDPGEKPVGGVGTIILEASCEPSAAQVLERIRPVVAVIAAQDLGNWPADERWRGLLPTWLNEKLRDYTRAESDQLLARSKKDRRFEIPWDFGSWIDSMKNRAWHWWQARTEGNLLTIELHIDCWPYSIAALEYLIKVAGAQSVEIRD